MDLTTGVSVLFHGEPPGGTARSEVRFPSPPDSEQDGGIAFASLVTLVSLKLAAAMSNRDRRRDLADVQEMIKELCLVEDFAERLHPNVQAEFKATCRSIDDAAGPFLLLWEIPSKPGTHPTDVLLGISGDTHPQLQAMLSDGVRLFEPRPCYEKCAVLATNDRVIARKYAMHHESEYFFKD